VARAFVAVSPPAAVLDAAEAFVAPELASISGVQWTRREQRHLTLQFLGNRVDLDLVGSAMQALPRRAGAVALGSVGAFPSARRARVLWIGVTEGADFLMTLAISVGALLAPLGYEPEVRDYHPHLTLARFKAPRDVRAEVEAHASIAVGNRFDIVEVVLYESVTRKTGAVYTPHTIVRLDEPD